MFCQAVKIPLMGVGAMLLSCGMSTNAQATSLYLGEFSLISSDLLLQESDLIESAQDSTHLEWSCDIPLLEPKSALLDDESRLLSRLGPTLIAQLEKSDSKSDLIAQPNLITELEYEAPDSMPISVADLSVFPETACQLVGGATGGAGTGLNPVLASPLGLLSLIALAGSGETAPGLISSPLLSLSEDNEIVVTFPQEPFGASRRLANSTINSATSVPEPMTVFGTGLALGVGVFLERKRSKSQKTD